MKRRIILICIFAIAGLCIVVSSCSSLEDVDAGDCLTGCIECSFEFCSQTCREMCESYSFQDFLGDACDFVCTDMCPTVCDNLCTAASMRELDESAYTVEQLYIEGTYSSSGGESGLSVRYQVQLHNDYKRVAMTLTVYDLHGREVGEDTVEATPDEAFDGQLRFTQVPLFEGEPLTSVEDYTVRVTAMKGARA